MLGTLSGLLTWAVSKNLLENLEQRVRLEDGRLPCGTLEDLTLAIPARNEERNLRVLLPQILDQRQRPRKLLLLDDQSTDGTAALIDAFSARHSFIERLEGEPLPQGWRGKVWALHQLLRQVETPYVLFLDADVRLVDNRALGSLWQNARHQQAAFFSVFPRYQRGLGASLLVDQIYTHLYFLLPAHPERLGPRADAAVAGCGQIMLLKASELRELGGLGRIRSSTHDGLQLARLYRQAGRTVVAADGKDFFHCELYPSFAAAFRGFSRNSFEASRSSWPVALGLAGVLFWVFVLPYVLWPFLLLNPGWMVAFLFLLYAQFRLAQEFDLGLSHVLLSPVKACASIGVHLWGATRSQLRIATDWKGRAVT